MRRERTTVPVDQQDVLRVIDEVRAEAGMSANELCRRMGVDASNYARARNGKLTMPLAHVLAASRVLGIRITMERPSAGRRKEGASCV